MIPDRPAPLAAASSGAARLLELVRSDDPKFVARWVEGLRSTGGIYASMDNAGLTALATETIALIHRLIAGGALTDEAARRYVDPPPYRNQPIDEFVRAGIHVMQVLRDVLHEATDDPDVAGEALALIDPIMSAAIVKVVHLRELELGGAQLLSAVHGLLRRAAVPHEGFRKVAVKLAHDLGAGLCLVVAVDEDDVSIYATSGGRAGAAVHAGDHFAREEIRWLNDGGEHGRSEAIDSSARGLESHLATAGFRGAWIQPLMALGRLVGVVAIFRRATGPFPIHARGHLSTVAPLLAAELGFARQLGTLQRAEIAIQQLYDAAPTMMCTLDRLGRIVRTSRRFREELGVPDDVVGMPLAWLVHPAWHERFIPLWQRIRSDDALGPRRVDLITTEGDRLAVSIEAHWIRDELGATAQCMIAMWNVSAHLAREKAQSARIDELSAFAHHVAHDLKAPLRTISGFTSMLVEELEEYDDIDSDVRAKLQAHAEQVRLAAESSGRMVESLLRYAHSTANDEGAGKPVALVDLAESASTQLAADLSTSRATVEIVADETPLLGQRGALTTLVVNLIANGLRYSDGARVEIGVRAVEPGWAELFVRDFGVGIEDADQDRIFELFERGTGGVQARRAGHGVGLAIVRRIARRHGGEVRVESEMGRGSVFIVRLPTP